MKNGLRYVYIGNAPGHIQNSTFCSFCHRKIIYHTEFDAFELHLADGKCNSCGSPIPGKWA